MNGWTVYIRWKLESRANANYFLWATLSQQYQTCFLLKKTQKSSELVCLYRHFESIRAVQ
jgi:hypothetical protein